jgi:translation elongation factor P/translation initiation factor 5A
MSKSINVIHFGKTKKRKLRGWQGADDVFMHASQVKIGARIRYHGRTDHGSVWQVTEIRTLEPGRGYNVKSVHSVQRLKDEVILIRVGKLTKEKRQITFSYMSYSAIWRMDK